jgi:hypothetical protein
MKYDNQFRFPMNKIQDIRFWYVTGLHESCLPERKSLGSLITVPRQYREEILHFQMKNIPLN